MLVHSGSVDIGCVIFSTIVQNKTSLAYINYCLKISAVCANLVKLSRNRKDLNEITAARFSVFFLLLATEKKTPKMGQL